MSPQRLINRVRRAAKQVRSVAPVRIRDGIGADLKMDLRRASAWYGKGTNEQPIQQAMATHLHPGETFYDVGANIGFFTLIGARLVGPAGRAVAFEPVALNAAAIRRNAALNRFANVQVVEAAVSDAEGRGELLVSEHPGGAALAAIVGSGRAQRSSISVPTVTLDGVVERGEAPPPALVKVDVEGAELAVLAGMARTVARVRPKIICEVDDASAAALAPRLREVREMIAAWGYQVEELAPSYPGSRWAVVHLLGLPRGA